LIPELFYEAISTADLIWRLKKEGNGRGR